MIRGMDWMGLETGLVPNCFAKATQLTTELSLNNKDLDSVLRPLL